MSLGAEARVSGDMVNAVLPEEQQDAALEVLRRDAQADFADAGAQFAGGVLHPETEAPTDDQKEEAATAGRKPERGGRMNSRIGYIAFNTFREAVRDRVLYNLIAFALLLSGAAILVGEISIDIERLVVVNLGLTAVSLFGVVIAIFIGIGLVSKEIEKRTLYTVLSRPVRRWEFVVGKFFGLTGTLVVNTFFMALGVFLALLYVAHKFEKMDVWVLVALYFIVLQFLIVCALALFFSSFSTPLMSAVFTFALFVIGSLAEDLRGFARITTDWAVAGDRHRLSGAEFFRLERDQPGGARRSRTRTADSLQHRVRAAVFGDGDLGSGADLPAPEPEMSATRRVNLARSRCFAFAGGRMALHAIDRRTRHRWRSKRFICALRRCCGA
jgi:Cu-processing system permease protein